jgi:hypothetical protein
MELALETTVPLPDVPLHAVDALTKVSLRAMDALASLLHLSSTWTQSEPLPDVPLHLTRGRHHQLDAIAVKTEGKEHQRHTQRQQDQGYAKHQRDNQ